MKCKNFKTGSKGSIPTAMGSVFGNKIKQMVANKKEEGVSSARLSVN